MANAELLNQVVNEIQNALFHWDQSSWIFSDEVPSGLSPEKFKNECGTSYCFAGRVASLKREPVFYRDETPDGTEVYFASAWLTALESDHSDHETIKWVHYIPRVRDGKVVFEPYSGRIITAENAAVQDLDLTQDQAWDLFDSNNELYDIREIVENIIDGSYDDEETDCDCGCNG